MSTIVAAKQKIRGLGLKVVLPEGEDPRIQAAADVLVHAPYAWFKDVTPDDPLIRDWVARCMARPSRTRTLAADAAAMAQAAAAA